MFHITQGSADILHIPYTPANIYPEFVHKLCTTVKNPVINPLVDRKTL